MHSELKVIKNLPYLQKNSLIKKVRNGFKIISICLLIFSGGSQGQYLLRGVIMNSDSSLKLNWAVVKNLKSRIGTLSNDSGFYKVLVNQNDEIEFSKLGYQTKKIIYKGELIINVVLIASDNLLDEIVVSASKSDQSLKNTSVSMEIIKPYLIQNKNPNTVENTIDQIPGVQTVNGQVVMRSGSGWSYGTGSRVMVMLDGMPMLSGDAGSVQWSFLPIENMESMEVIKGASSVLFGSSALNGVINIKTAKPTKIPETKVSTFYGIYNPAKSEDLNWSTKKVLSTYGIRAYHGQKIGKNAISLTLNGFNDNGYRMSDRDERMRFGAQYRRDIKKIEGYAGLNGNIQYGKSSSFLLWENNKQAYTALDSSVTNSGTFRLNIDPYLVMNKNKWRHLVQARYFRLGNTIEDNSAGSSNQSNYSNTLYGEYQVSKTITEDFKIIGGLVGNFAVSNSPLYQGLQKATNKSAYIQANKKIGLLNVDIGARFENYSLNNYKESKPVLRAGLSRKMALATFLRASFGQGYRFPTIAESYVLTSAGPIKIYPNNQLKSEKGWNAEVGIKQGLRWGKTNAILDLAGFWMHYDRMMEFTFAQWEKPTLQNPLPVGFKSVNVSDAKIQGIDLSLGGNRKWKKSELKWLMGYTYTKAIATKPDEIFYTDSVGNALTFNNTSSNPNGHYLKYRPKNLLRADIQYEIQTWQIGYSLRYNSYLQNIDKAFVSFPIANVVPGVQNVRDKGKNGDYIMDLRLGKTLKNYRILFIVNNLLNRTYMTRPCDMRPPRSMMLQFNWILK